LLSVSSGGRLYECYTTISAQELETLKVPMLAKFEVAGLQWLDPEDQRPRDWRYRRRQLAAIRSAMEQLTIPP